MRKISSLAKFTFTFLLLITLTVPSTAQAVPNVMGHSSAQQNMWNQQYATNGEYWNYVLEQANSSGIYADQGMRDGMVFLVTGNSAYATSAWGHVKKWCGHTYEPPQAATDPSWCTTQWNGLPPRNATRDQFVRLALLYSWVASGLSSQDRANFKDVVDFWASLTMGEVAGVTHGTRNSDSDELLGHYFGLMIYALAIADEDPARSNYILNGFQGNSTAKPTGGLNATAANYDTMRNAVKMFFERALGGQWIESTEYNLNSVRYAFVGVQAVNNHAGSDKFPEITSLYDDFAKAFVQELTPDFKDSFQWGDNGEAHQLKLFNRVPLMNAVGAISGDPEALFVADLFYDQNFPTTTADAWHLLLDPYSPRQAPQGQSDHNAPSQGMAYWHEGWNPNDSFFASKMQKFTGADHDWATLSNFNLYRNGHWAILNPRGYYGGKLDEPYMNGLMVSGGVSRTNEASGQTAYEAGSNYLYHAGATAGQIMNEKYDDPPREFVHEWNRSILYLHNDDNSDTVLVFDRLNNCDPQDTVNCMSNWKFKRHADLIENRINAAGAKHQWIMHMPDPNPSINGDTISWLDEGGETVTLKTFMNNYTTAFYDENAEIYQGAPLYLTGAMNSENLKYQLRLIPNQKDGFQTFFNVIHVGSNLNATEVTSSSGENAQGALLQTGTQNTLVMFNAKENTPPDPSSINGPPNGYSSTHNPQRHALTADLRLFKSGYNMVVDVDGQTDVFLMDLDPARTWEITVNGAVSTLDVSGQGVAKLTLPDSGNYQVSIVSDGVSSPDAIIGNNSITGNTVVFDGSQSFNPNEATFTYLWDFGDGNTSTAVNPVHTYAQEGMYDVTLTLTDGVEMDEDYAQVEIGVSGGSSNQAPILSAIADEFVMYDEPVNIAVSAGDPEGDDIILSVTLDNGDDISTVGASFVDNGDGTGNFTWTPGAGDAGDNVFFFKAFDGEFQDLESVLISVQGPFVAEYHWYETEHPNGMVAPMKNEIDPTASDGGFIQTPLGNVDYWAPGSVMTTIDITVENAGDYVLWTRVSGDDGDHDSFYVQIDNGLNNLFDIPYGQGWVWEQVSDRNLGLAVFNLSAGTHTIKIKAREDATRMDKILLTNDLSYIPSGFGDPAVNAEGEPEPPVNEAPTAVAQVVVVDDLTVTFTGSASSDPEDDILSFFWDFGDGNTSTEENPVHTYADGDTYNVTLTVNDGELDSIDTLQVTVIAPNQAPVAVIAQPEIDELQVVFDASGSYDPEGLDLTYLWDFGDGQTSIEETPTHIYAENGTYLVTLTVNDGELIDDTSVEVTVEQTFIAEYHWLEAEFADSMISPLQLGTDGTASEGNFMYVANGSGSYWSPTSVMATYTVTVAEEGDYLLYGRVNAPNGNDDSFFIQIDNGANILWDVPYGQGWVWDRVQDRDAPTYMVVHLTPGTHTIKVKAREDGTKIDKLLLTNDVNYTPVGGGQEAENIPDVPEFAYMYMEAEDAVITNPFQVKTQSTASANEYIVAPNGSGSQWVPSSKMATFTVNITQPGEYILHARVDAPTGNDDSFFVQVDNGVDNLWDIDGASGWHWEEVTDRNNPVQLKFNLTAGTHTIKFKLREDGTKLDKILLTNDLEFSPTGMGE